MLSVAYRLGKDPDEVLAMPPDLFLDWIEYFKIIDQKPKSGRGKGVRLSQLPGF